MLDIFIERFRQKHRTYPYPAKSPVLPERFRGLPSLQEQSATNATQWKNAIEACPANALCIDAAGPVLDMGKCSFCGVCASDDLVTFSKCWQLAATKREDLLIRPGRDLAPPPVIVDAKMQKLFAKSFRLRQVSAAGCNACEADLNVLTTLVFDISRFGMDFVASPRHADAMVITGPVTRNMQLAVGKVEAAMPYPRIVVAVGACAISGGLFAGEENKQQAKGVAPHLDTTLHIPGCPPHPYTLLDGFLRLLGRG